MAFADAVVEGECAEPLAKAQQLFAFGGNRDFLSRP
jgi:hypothetical protein